MKIKEIRDLNVEELSQKVVNLKKELYSLNYQKKMGTLEKPTRFRLIRRDIARILTIKKERESENGRNTQKRK